MLSNEAVQAMTLIESLRHGDRVKVTREGRELEMTVVGRPRRSDGSFGDALSVGVTVELPNGVTMRVEAGDLVRTPRGRGFVGGGTTLEKL
ncbi:MAG TPA: hypothetical protein VK545_09800 [Streptomyces sp.]|nr:hypothetical protein [Streptomyces sp.]